MASAPFDIVVVGGGPVGLHAALKAAVLNHEVLLIDKGTRFSRICQASSIANIPGAPGISGAQLLERGRDAIERFEAMAGRRLVTWRKCVEAVGARREGGLFALRLRGEDGGEEEIRCRVLVLATGVVDRKPGIEIFYERGHETLAPWVHRSDIGYCILCEGWSLEDKDIAVIGSSADAAQIALDVAGHFQAGVKLLTDGARVDAETAARLSEAGIPIEARPLASIGRDDGRLALDLEDGARLRFDKAFFGLGWYKVNNELAVALGARTTKDGYVVTDETCEVLDAHGERIEGLFAIGDLRAGRWKQIVVGWGDAETAIISAYATRLPSATENGRASLSARAPRLPTRDPARTPMSPTSHERPPAEGRRSGRMPDEKQDNNRRADRQEPTNIADTDEGGSTVHGGGLGGNELGARQSAVGTVKESDLKPGERRRSGIDVKE